MSYACNQDVPLLKTKLYAPPTRPELVPRPRLVERLNAELQGPGPSGHLGQSDRFARRLTLLSAPAGFGKTTLVAEWLHCAHVPSAWLSLDQDDNDPIRFLIYLTSAIETVCPDVGQDVRALLQSPQPTPIKSALTILINSLTAAQSRLILALDDYHTIAQESIHDALAFLLDHLPPYVHLVIVSRTDPPLPLARLRTRGQLTEIRATDLRFTPEEAAAFLNDAMGLDLSPQDIATLETRTEGWISGLQLAALSMREQTDRTQFIAAFRGSHRHVIDYLAEEVLARQPTEIHDFLCQTAILDRLTASLCAAVTGREDSETILRRLEQANLFLLPLDDQRQWYRYHRLFADFLRNHLQQDMPERVHDLHRWAAEWHEQNGLFAEAIRHTLQAQEFEWAARLIEQVAQTMLMHGEGVTWLNWATRLPQDMRGRHPWLCAYLGWGFIISGQLSEVEACLQMLEVHLRTPGADDQADLRQQVNAIRAMMAMYTGEIEMAAELGRQTLQTLSETNWFLRGILSWLIGLTYYFDRDTAFAQRVFSETLERSQTEDNTMLALLSLFVAGYLQMMQGHLGEALSIFERGLQLERASEQVETNPDALLGFSLVYQGLSDVTRERNDLAQAEQHAARCIDLGERWGNAEVLADDYVVQTRIKQALGKLDEAQAAMHKVEALIDEGKLVSLTVRQVEAHRVRLWLARNDVRAAERWAEAWHERHSDGQEQRGLITLYMRVAECSSLARLALEQRHFADAIALVSPLLDEVQKAGWGGGVIELLALQALAWHGQGRPEEAFTALRQALSLGQPEGYARVFLDLGKPMETLLSAFGHHPSVAAEMKPYVHQLVSAFAGDRRQTTATSPSLIDIYQPIPSLQLLSDRELEVLRLIADGLTNAEIAGRLYVTISTVKTHVNNIYRKLDVAKRTQAVARARELKLL